MARSLQSTLLRIARPASNRWARLAVIPVMAAVLLATQWVPDLNLRRYTARQIHNQLIQAPDEEAAELLVRLAELDDPGLPRVTAALGDERTTVSVAAYHLLQRKLDQWSMLSQSEATEPVVRLAESLAAIAPSLGPNQRAHAASLAERILRWPTDRAETNDAQLIVDCESVINLHREAVWGMQLPPLTSGDVDASRIRPADPPTASKDAAAAPIVSGRIGDDGPANGSDASLSADQSPARLNLSDAPPASLSLSDAPPEASLETSPKDTTPKSLAISPLTTRPLKDASPTPFASSPQPSTPQPSSPRPSNPIVTHDPMSQRFVTSEPESMSEPPSALQEPARLEPTPPPSTAADDTARGAGPSGLTAAERDAMRQLADVDVMRMLHHEIPAYSIGAIDELQRRGFQSRHLRLARRLTDPSVAERRGLAIELPTVPSINPTPWLQQLLKDSDQSVVSAATIGLQSIPKQSYRDRLRRMRAGTLKPPSRR